MRRVTAVVTGMLAVVLVAACSQATTGGAPVERTPTATSVPASPESTATAAPAPAPGLVLLDISGRDSHQSEAFTAAGSWDVSWEVQGDVNRSPGAVLSALLFDAAGKPVAPVFSATVDTGGQRSDVTHMHAVGTFYVEISGLGAWHLKAVTT